MFFNKSRKTQEELNEEYSKLGEDEDTGVVGTEDIEEVSKQAKIVQKQPQKTAVKPKISHSEPLSSEEEDSFPLDIKEYAETFNNEFSRLVEPDKNFNVLFALYVEQKRTNKLLKGLNVLLEDLNQKAGE